MKFIAKTFYGLEGVLAKELNALGVKEITESNRAVIFNGNLRTMYAVNYLSRTAISVLWQISAFRIHSVDDLCRKAMEISWENFMDVDNTFSVTAVVQSALFNHSGFAALKLKDSIADYFRNTTGRRPSVNTENADIRVNLHIANDKVTVSLDSSGEPLFKRAYRLNAGTAPINEVLAAGLIYLSGWDGSSDFTDPMCGSGTIAIEAGLISCKIPPGKFRGSFAFQRWKNYDDKIFADVKSQAEGLIKTSPGTGISAYDISPEAIRIAESNCLRAGLGGAVRFAVCDFRELQPLSERGYLILNPPYGERISQGDTDELYSMIGSTLKHRFHGHSAWLISPNKDSMRFIGLKPAAKYKLFNGALECIYAGYELYSGSRKK